MKKFKKLLAVMMCVVIAATVPACSNGGGNADEPAATTTINEKQELDQVDWENVAADTVDENSENGTGSLYESGKTAGEIKALCYYDLASTQPELAKLFAERFGGTVVTEVTTSGSAYFDKLATCVASGDSPDIVRYDWMAYPWGTSKNIYQPLDEWLDMDSELWAGEKDVIESFNYAGKHYYYPSSVSTNFAIIYNKNVVQEAGLDDPLELYNANNWNWNTFESLIRKWADQGSDYIGFTGGSWSAMMFINTTGTKVIDVTGTDIINNMNNQNVQRTMDWLSGLKKEGLVGEGFTDPAQAFVDGKLLFLGMGLTWGYESALETFYKQGTEAEMYALPFPRDPNADKYYLSADSFGFLVPAGAENTQGAIDWILCGRIYETDPETRAADYAKKTDTDPYYYARCAECKYNFVENGTDDLDTCPECNAPRKQKFKAIYSEEEMQVIYDMLDPEKFSFVFDNSVGFGDDLSTVFTGDENSVYDGPLYYGTSYTQLRDANYQTVESYIQPFRDAIKESLNEN